MSSERSIHRAQVVAWLNELLPVWETPVTVAMLHEAHPEITAPVYAGALKHMTLAGILRATTGHRDRVFYFPEAKITPCDIQIYLCKGRLDNE